VTVWAVRGLSSAPPGSFSKQPSGTSSDKPSLLSKLVEPRKLHEIERAVSRRTPIAEDGSMRAGRLPKDVRGGSRVTAPTSTDAVPQALAGTGSGRSDDRSVTRKYGLHPAMGY
jgi:hypothetical protein